MTKFLSFIGRVDPDLSSASPSEPTLSVTPLLYPDNRPVTSLHELIEKWDAVNGDLVSGQPVEKLDEVEILAPLRGRDVLCVGKNYKEHAAEFHNSGYDSSDKTPIPTHPVIFTKRSTSITAHKSPIYPHPDVTKTLDYEGELAIIVGKGGIGIKKEDAWDHVWGATIVNDVTARERQRDHKQFYIGKSLDTFCPMFLHQSTSELIFDIPTLIATCSMGITLQPGDIIATGTPLGVCLSTGVFMKSGDKVDISITGLGTLSNTVAEVGDGPIAYLPIPTGLAR